MKNLTREKVIEAAQRAAQQSGGILSRADFERITGISQYHIYNLFPKGGWSEVQKLAGIEKHPRYRETLPDNDLLAEYHRVVSLLGDIPTWPILNSNSTISSDVIRRRFGGLQGTLKRYRIWLEENEPNSPILEKLQARSKHEIPPPALPEPDTSLNSSLQWPKGEAIEYGAPINFRGLRHAPINEQGVVYLFGMISYELGFLVEAIHTSYPDCEAKRCIDRKRNRWQRVRIEFEYQSSNFRDHGHDPSNCDLIVCWEHNWPESPLEVIELRKVIDKLGG